MHNKLENNIRGIYKQHNEIEIEESLKEYGFKVQPTEVGYVFKSEKDFIMLDDDGKVLESSIELPYYLQVEIQSRIKKSNEMLNLIW